MTKLKRPTGHLVIMDPCSICLEVIDETATTLHCSHNFHKKCVELWFLRASTCPMCRAAVPGAKVADDDSSGELGEIPVILAYSWDELMENFELETISGGGRMRRRRWSDNEWLGVTEQSIIDSLFL